jgi:hypothetical protein
MNPNQPIKSGLRPITAPGAPAGAGKTPSLPAKLSNLERLEKALIGKFFHFVYAGGTRFRAGKFAGVLAETYFLVRYFSMRDMRLQAWTHIIRFYDAPSIEDLTGFWLHDSEVDLRAAHESFLQYHIRAQEQKRAALEKDSNGLEARESNETQAQKIDSEPSASTR